MWYMVVRQDGKDGPMAMHSMHRTLMAAQSSRERTARDSYWGLYLLTIRVAERKPKKFADLATVTLRIA